MVQNLLEKMLIRHLNSTPYEPQMNDGMEVTNKNIKKILGKMIGTYKDQYEMLPYAPHAYCITIKMLIGANILFFG